MGVERENTSDLVRSIFVFSTSKTYARGQVLSFAMEALNAGLDRM
jgi:hypothetical protein